MATNSAANNGGASSFSQREINIKWTDEISLLFIELYLAQLDKENWVDKFLTKEGKLSVRTSFKEATGLDLTWKIFANHHHNLKTWYDCYNRLCKFTGVAIDHNTGIIIMEKEWWNDRIQENEVAKRFRKKPLAYKDLLEKLFSGTHIGIEDGWSVGNGPDVYHPQHGHEPGEQFDINTSSFIEDPDTSRGASNNDNQSDLSKAFCERSDAIKSAATEMSSALTSDVTMAARQLHQISEIEFGTSFYWDATKLLSEDEVARRWLIGIPENKFALLYLEQMIGRKHDE
ncbi:unnamed protein product [Arabis nemorensis]|uniref:Myb/SANT-like domain-containing protein n=1 Tax=Arabis nemorensis TaxID=586526 RepID=A0A565BI60_9BRAS|nr:unnamed protein product [Arabis nemorensis]